MKSILSRFYNNKKCISLLTKDTILSWFTERIKMTVSKPIYENSINEFNIFINDILIQQLSAIILQLQVDTSMMTVSLKNVHYGACTTTATGLYYIPIICSIIINYKNCIHEFHDIIVFDMPVMIGSCIDTLFLHKRDLYGTFEIFSSNVSLPIGYIGWIASRAIPHITRKDDTNKIAAKVEYYNTFGNSGAGRMVRIEICKTYKKGVFEYSSTIVYPELVNVKSSQDLNSSDRKKKKTVKSVSFMHIVYYIFMYVYDDTNKTIIHNKDNIKEIYSYLSHEPIDMDLFDQFYRSETVSDNIIDNISTYVRGGVDNANDPLVIFEMVVDRLMPNLTHTDIMKSSCSYNEKIKFKLNAVKRFIVDNIVILLYTLSGKTIGIYEDFYSNERVNILIYNLKTTLSYCIHKIEHDLSKFCISRRFIDDLGTNNASVNTRLKSFFRAHNNLMVRAFCTNNIPTHTNYILPPPFKNLTSNAPVEIRFDTSSVSGCSNLHSTNKIGQPGAYGRIDINSVSQLSTSVTLSSYAKISDEIPPIYIYRILRKNIDNISATNDKGAYNIYINNIYYFSTDQLESVTMCIKKMRRCVKTCTVTLTMFLNNVYIWCDYGRLLRTVVVCNSIKYDTMLDMYSKFTSSLLTHGEQLDYMIQHGIIEYVTYDMECRYGVISEQTCRVDCKYVSIGSIGSIDSYYDKETATYDGTESVNLSRVTAILRKAVPQTGIGSKLLSPHSNMHTTGRIPFMYLPVVICDSKGTIMDGILANKVMTNYTIFDKYISCVISFAQPINTRDNISCVASMYGRLHSSIRKKYDKNTGIIKVGSTVDPHTLLYLGLSTSKEKWYTLPVSGVVTSVDITTNDNVIVNVYIEHKISDGTKIWAGFYKGVLNTSSNMAYRLPDGVLNMLTIGMYGICNRVLIESLTCMLPDCNLGLYTTEVSLGCNKQNVLCGMMKIYPNNNTMYSRNTHVSRDVSKLPNNMSRHGITRYGGLRLDWQSMFFWNKLFGQSYVMSEHVTVFICTGCDKKPDEIVRETGHNTKVVTSVCCADPDHIVLAVRVPVLLSYYTKILKCLYCIDTQYNIVPYGKV